MGVDDLDLSQLVLEIYFKNGGTVKYFGVGIKTALSPGWDRKMKSPGTFLIGLHTFTRHGLMLPGLKVSLPSAKVGFSPIKSTY